MNSNRFGIFNIILFTDFIGLTMAAQKASGQIYPDLKRPE
jgi:hypothetical protein